MLSSSTKKAITIASIGWLVFASAPPPEPTKSSAIFNQVEDNGGRYNKQIEARIKEDEERIRIDDNEIFQIIKTWVEQCQ